MTRDATSISVAEDADAVTSTSPPQTSSSPSLYARRAVGLVVLIALVAVAFLLSLAHGANPIPYADVWDAIWNRGENEASWIVWDQRLPRTVIGILTGAAFALAGALIQALTRNPLADSGILGVNAGAGLAVTVGVGLFGVMRDGQIVTTGDPADVMTPQLVEAVFGLKALVVPDPVTGTPTIVPLDPRSAEGSLGPVSPITEEA